MHSLNTYLDPERLTSDTAYVIFQIESYWIGEKTVCMYIKDNKIAYTYIPSILEVNSPKYARREFACGTYKDGSTRYYGDALCNWYKFQPPKPIATEAQAWLDKFLVTVKDWKPEYERAQVLDGTSWTLTYKLPGGQEHTHHAYATHPDNWKEFCELIHTGIDELC